MVRVAMPTPITIADAPRYVDYAPIASAGPFTVPFPLFSEGGADLYVALNDVELAGWTVTSDEAPGFFGAPNTWINVSVTLAAPVTGALHIEGRMAPRRLGQFAEGRGVPARDTNTELNRVTAALREIYDWMTPARQTLRDRPILDLVTSGINGLMRSGDYVKLQEVQAGAQVNRSRSSQSQAEGAADDSTDMSPRSTGQAVKKNAAAADYLDPRAGAVGLSIQSTLDLIDHVAKFGAVPVFVDGNTSGMDCTAAIQAALDTGRTVVLGRGFYKVTATLNLKTPGQLVQGQGRDATCIIFVTGFSGSAIFRTDKTVFRGTGQTGPRFEDFRIKGFQPDVNPALSISAQLASLIQVDLLDFRDTIAFSVRRMVLSGGMRAIDMRGNCGQAVIDDVQSIAFVTDIDIDGTLDSVRISKHHNFPLNVTPNQAALAAANAVAISSGRLDDLKVSDSMTIAAKTGLRFYLGGTRTVAADGYLSPGGHTTGSLTNHNCDIVQVGIRMEDGVINYNGGYFACQKVVNQTGGYLVLSGNYSPVNADGMLQVSGGTLVFSNSPAIGDPNTNFSFLEQAGGTVIFTNNFYSWGGSGNITKPKLNVTGGLFIGTGNVVTPFGTGTKGASGFFVGLGNYNAGHVFLGVCPGWTNSWGSDVLMPGQGNMQSTGSTVTQRWDGPVAGIRAIAETVSGATGNEATSWRVEHYRAGSWSMSFKLDHEGWPLLPKVVPLNAADDAAAAGIGIQIGGIYHNAGALRIRRS